MLLKCTVYVEYNDGSSLEEDYVIDENEFDNLENLVKQSDSDIEYVEFIAALCEDGSSFS